MPNGHVMVMAAGPCQVMDSQLVAYRQDFTVCCTFLLVFNRAPHPRETVIAICSEGDVSVWEQFRVFAGQQARWCWAGGWAS